MLEKNAQIGEGISSRNSEVIHAGIYYPKDSLKAKFCVRGKQLLYQYCRQHNIPHKKTGKLIVATEENQLESLSQLQQKALDNGVDDLSILSQSQVKRLEPQVNAVAGLYSPSSGIIDSHQLMLSLLGNIESNGGSLSLKTQVNKITPSKSGFILYGTSCGETFKIETRRLIIAAGLYSQKQCRQLEGYPASMIPDLYFVKGNYFKLNAKPPFKHLIYPLPNENLAGLGIHATLDLSGQVRFGPDVQSIKKENYQVDQQRLHHFYTNIRSYWPGIDQHSLTPDYAGIRPKLCDIAGPFKDFCIQTNSDHGLDNLITLMGIESPGLTSCLAIAEHVSYLICQGSLKPSFIFDYCG